jgi:hypothetical protein
VNESRGIASDPVQLWREESVRSVLAFLDRLATLDDAGRIANH